jgi:3'-phosphoadenosine 5'-phosphosulfate (PAPS) 3'-phosphatase
VRFDAYRKEAESALDIVRSAAKLCRQMQRGNDQERFEKVDGSTATTAVYASQAVVIRRLLTIFPEDVILAEEHSGELESVLHGEGLQTVAEYVKCLEPEANVEIVRN